jgi:hypothetical protein
MDVLTRSNEVLVEGTVTLYAVPASNPPMFVGKCNQCDYASPGYDDGYLDGADDWVPEGSRYAVYDVQDHQIAEHGGEL